MILLNYSQDIQNFYYLAIEFNDEFRNKDDYIGFSPIFGENYDEDLYNNSNQFNNYEPTEHWKNSSYNDQWVCDYEFPN